MSSSVIFGWRDSMWCHCIVYLSLRTSSRTCSFNLSMLLCIVIPPICILPFTCLLFAIHCSHHLVLSVPYFLRTSYFELTYILFKSSHQSPEPNTRVMGMTPAEKILAIHGSQNVFKWLQVLHNTNNEWRY